MHPDVQSVCHESEPLLFIVVVIINDILVIIIINILLLIIINIYIIIETLHFIFPIFTHLLPSHSKLLSELLKHLDGNNKVKARQS